MLWCRVLGFEVRRLKEIANYRNENATHDIWKNTRDSTSNQKTPDMTCVEQIEELVRKQREIAMFWAREKDGQQRSFSIGKKISGSKKGRPKK